MLIPYHSKELEARVVLEAKADLAARAAIPTLTATHTTLHHTATRTPTPTLTTPHPTTITTAMDIMDTPLS